MSLLLGGEELHALLKKMFEGYNLIKRSSEKKSCRRGFFPVCVGEERKKYVLPVRVFSSLCFQTLLNRYEDEIKEKAKAKAAGPISIPCSTAAFEAILSLVKAEKGRI